MPFARLVMKIGFLVGISFVCLDLYYCFSRPTSAQPETGRVYASESHGHVGYLNRREIDNVHLLRNTSGGLFVVACVIGLVIKLRKGENVRDLLNH
jgi:hypothetical protein